MAEIVVAHTADLEPALLAAGRALLYDVFDDMAADDWDHALGGVHVVAVEGAEVVGHASVVQRRLGHAGRALRCGYVEGVAVRGDRRRRGIAGVLMGEVERIVRGAYELGALGATDEALAFYGGRGWEPWRGRLSALTPTGLHETPDDRGAVLVLSTGKALDLDGELTADWRDGDLW